MAAWTFDLCTSGVRGVILEVRLAVQSDTDSIALLHAASWQRTYRGMMPDEFLDNAAVSNRLAVWRERMRDSQADRFTYQAPSENTRLTHSMNTRTRGDNCRRCG
jgi:hypothetical protein